VRKVPAVYVILLSVHRTTHPTTRIAFLAILN
jgi:hypothetical protein